MAESTAVALAAASIPSSAEIARAEKLVRERFVHEGEDPAVALAAGSPRRRALDQALVEVKEGAKHPSTAWRREFSLLLGLERVLSEDEPKLADGTVLSAHQVDALSGTLTALLAEAQRSAARQRPRGRAASPELLASAAILGPDDDGSSEPAPTEPSGVGSPTRPSPRPRPTWTWTRRTGTTRMRRTTRARTRTTRISVPCSAPRPTRTRTRTTSTTSWTSSSPSPSPRRSIEEESEEEPRDWVEEEDEEALAEQPEDPNAAKRFWFEHATGAGKTVAALGFVEASQTGGILILTHRRNLVDQFNGELRQRGYSKRICGPLYAGEDSPKGPVTVETYQWFVRNAGASPAPTRS